MKMEKVKTLEKKNHLLEIVSNRKMKYRIGTIALCGIGIALPRIFHVLAGSTAGSVFLPMHIAVLLATLTFGIRSGCMVAGTSVIGSYLLTGMPTLARMPYMLIELLIYAILLGLFHKKFNSYLSLIATMILGRVLYASILAVAIYGIGLPTYGISVMESIKIGLPGIVIQLLCVPFIAKAIVKGADLD